VSFANSCELGCYFQVIDVDEDSVSLKNMPSDPLRPKAACLRAWKHLLFYEWVSLNLAVKEADPLPLWLTSLYNSPEMDANQATVELAQCLGEDPPIDKETNPGRVILAEMQSLAPPPGQENSLDSSAAAPASNVDGITTAISRIGAASEPAVINIDSSNITTIPTINSDSNSTTTIAPGSDPDEKLEQLPSEEILQVIEGNNPPLTESPPIVNNDTTAGEPNPDPNPSTEEPEEQQQQQEQDNSPTEPPLNPSITGNDESESPPPESDGDADDSGDGVEDGETTPETPEIAPNPSPKPTPKPSPKPAPKPAPKPDKDEANDTESTDGSSGGVDDDDDIDDVDDTNSASPGPVKPVYEDSANGSEDQGTTSDESEEEVDRNEQTSNSPKPSSKGSDEEKEEEGKVEEVVEEEEESNNETKPSPTSAEDWAVPGDYEPVIITPAFTRLDPKKPKKPTVESTDAAGTEAADLHLDGEHLLQAGGNDSANASGASATTSDDLDATDSEEEDIALPQVAKSTSSSIRSGTGSVASTVALGTAAATVMILLAF